MLLLRSVYLVVSHCLVEAVWGSVHFMEHLVLSALYGSNDIALASRLVLSFRFPGGHASTILSVTHAAQCAAGSPLFRAACTTHRFSLNLCQFCVHTI